MRKINTTSTEGIHAVMVSLCTMYHTAAILKLLLPSSDLGDQWISEILEYG